MLEREFQYYFDHQEELVKKYNGEVLAIIGENVVGAYNSDTETLTETTKTNELRIFLIQKCTQGEEAYTMMFYFPNVVFA